ncbi:MAG: hypothetical protein Q8O55_02395 [Dehalococcoidales bacterium]|nr:hypothetical protein [Dehalococcoidales bacterium]
MVKLVESGIFIPLSAMPAFARNITFVSPLTYFTDLARYAMGAENYFPIGIDFSVLIMFK